MGFQKCIGEKPVTNPLVDWPTLPTLTFLDNSPILAQIAFEMPESLAYPERREKQPRPGNVA